MGYLRKVGRKIGKGIRKLGRGIKNAFGKLGPIGTLALYYMMPTIAHKFTNGLTSLSKMGNASNANFLMKTAGKLADATHYAAKGIGTVHNGITKAMTTGLDAITGPLDVGSKLSNFINDKRLDYGADANNQWTKNIQALADKETDKALKLKWTNMLPETSIGSTREAADIAAKTAAEKEQPVALSSTQGVFTQKEPSPVAMTGQMTDPSEVSPSLSPSLSPSPTKKGFLSSLL